MVEDSSGFKASLARSTKRKPSWLDKHEVRSCSETMPWSTRYSPSRLPERAHSSSALVKWSWESRPASIRTWPSLRRRLGDPDSSGRSEERRVGEVDSDSWVGDAVVGKPG